MRQPSWTDAALNDDHVADRCSRMCCAGGGRLSQRSDLVPATGADVHDVHVAGGAGQTDACDEMIWA